MTRSQPISLTSAATNPEATAPVPFLLVIPGYDAAETQTLKNVEGVLTWVTNAEYPGYDATETQTLKNVEGVLTWVTDEP